MFKFLRRARDPQKALRQALGKSNLPSFPAVAMKALEQIRLNTSSMDSVGETIMTDPGLSARLLRMVNSATHGLKRPVDTVSHAASLLGRAQVEATLLTVAVHRALPRETNAYFDPCRFWLAAARRACAARAYARILHPSTQATAYTSALLQDMAIPLLATVKAESYGPIFTQWLHDGGDLCALEREAFSWDHAEVASWMCCEWKFPEMLAESVTTHHEQETCLPAASLVALLREDHNNPGTEEIIETAHHVHGIPTDDSVQLLETSFTEAEKVAQLFSSAA